MKRHIGLTILAIFLGGITSLLVIVQAQAQIDAFTFFIPYPADIVDDQFSEGNSDISLDEDIETTISIAIERDNTIIYYDHWEGTGATAGLEANLTQPVQASTQVWGDGNAANGTAPGIPGDILSAGDVIVLQNTVVVPRDPTVFFFDGGDKLTAVGGSVAVSLALWTDTDDGGGPITPDIGIRYAGAWELYPTSRWGVEYVAPVGENLAGQRDGFEVVGLNVQAALDNTTIEIDLDGDGTVEHTATLNQGEQFTLVGEQTGIDPLQSVTTGSIVRATNGQPIQVHLFTAYPLSNPGWEARAYSLVPTNQWQNSYLAPRSSDGDYWLYNPNGTDMTITAQMSATTASIFVSAMSTVQFPTGTVFTTTTGVQFTSDNGDPFYGVAALNDAAQQDWGYALLPVANLSTQTLVGWGPGNENNPPNGDQSRVYVTAATATTVNVIYSDGTTASFPVSPFQEVPITDPVNHDMTGAFLFTTDGTPFVAVWGQDEGAQPGSPSIDVGTGIVPLPSLSIQKSVALLNDLDGTGTITWGDIVAFTITAYNNSAVNIVDGTIEDTLPANLTYIPGTSTVNGAGIPDKGATPFPFDEGGYNVGVIPNRSSVNVSFQASVNDNVDNLENGASATGDGGTAVSDPVGIVVPLRVPRYEFDKRLISPADGQSAAGQVVTFGLTITSTGNISITKMPLRDTFDENHLTFVSATPPPDTTGPGIINWNDLTTTFGPLVPSQTIFITVTYNVDAISNTITNTTNVATVEGAEGSDGSPLPVLTDTAQVFFEPLIPNYEFDKRLISPADGQSAAGQVVTFGLTITSTGNISITKMPLRDTFDENHLTFVSATPPPDTTGPGIINWNDLTTSFGPLVPSQTVFITVTYNVDPIPNTVTNTVNVATVEGAEGGNGVVLPTLTDTAQVFFEPLVANYELDKRLISPANGQTSSGQVITFGITITSTGNISITKMPLRDTFDENHLTFVSATPPPDATGSGIINWNDLTTVFGPLLPGQAIFLTVTYTVDPIPGNVASTINVATVEGAEGSNGIPLPTLSDSAQVFFPTSSSGSGDTAGGGDDDDDDGDPPPTPTPTPNVPAAPRPPQSTPELPVLFLPETGLRDAVDSGGGVNGGIFALLTFLSVGYAIYYVRRKSKDKR